MARERIVADDAKPITKIPVVAAVAPGQALGYSLQYTRLTAMLLEAPPGAMCSLEVLDDVAEQSSDGKTKLAQSKSALTVNPVSNRAISLWKTLFNWLELVKQGFVDPDQAIFELYVSREVEGPLVSALHSAGSVEAARTALDLARAEIWGEAPEYPDKCHLPESLARYVNPVLEADEALLLPIIVNLQLKCGSGSPQADLEVAIRQHPISGAKVLDIANQLCGWVKRQVDKKLEQGLPAIISRDEFHAEYTAYVRRVDRDLLLVSLAPNPTHEEIEQRLPSRFVRQLDLIGLDFDCKLGAISDFLRSSWDRTLWSKAGDVHEESFVELDNALCRVWTNLRQAGEIEAAFQGEVGRGRLLHARCMIHQATVQGIPPPPHFIPGCFHRLADEPVLGWHPAYERLLETAMAVER